MTETEILLQRLKERRALERFQALAIEAAGGATAYNDLPGLYDRMGRALDLDDGGEDFQPIGDLVDDYIRHLDDKPSYIPTGIGKLDRYLQLSPGNFLLIGGRPSAGKTALSLQMAVEQAMREAAEHDVKATLPYIRSILDRCQAQGIRTLAAWQAAHRGGGAKRVDRAQPSGNDFLEDAVTRPRRHKRKEY